MGLVYLATNKTNGKYYVGQTMGVLKERQRTHMWDVKKDKKTPFCNALRKYHGIDGFNWEIIHDGVETYEELNKLEIYYISQYNSMVDNDRGYNADSGGKNKIPSLETRRKISEKAMGRAPWNRGIPRTEEEKKKMSESNTGHIMSEETKMKLSEVMKGENNPFYGKSHTLETKEKISKANSGKKHSDETRQKWGEQRKGSKRSEETKKKMSESAKQRGMSDNFRKSRSKTYKIIKPNGTEEAITNLSAYCRENNLNIGCMCDVAKGNRNHHKNYKCELISQSDQ